MAMPRPRPLARLLAPVFLLAFVPASARGGIGSGACLTSSIAEHLHGREIEPDVAREVRRVLAFPRGDEWFSYVSPSGLIEIHYTNTGPDRVFQQDLNPANGIPDLVENSAVWMDIAWATEVDSLGYPEPPLPADGTYDVTFLAFADPNVLGACGPQAAEGPDHTNILLRRTFNGFPPTDAALLAQGTIAHEFKHASQYLVNHWVVQEVGWVELDADWVVDHVFDEAEYGRTLQYPGSQLSTPEQSLDHGGYGSYLDYLFEEYLTLKHGLPILHDFWGLRAATPAQAVLDTYRDTQLLYGADWSSTYPEYMEWCFFSGSLADPSFGFPEADLYIDAALREPVVGTYPHAAADAVAHLACHHRRFVAGTNPSRSPRVLFDGAAGDPDFTVSVISGFPDGSFDIVRPAMDAGHDLDWISPVPWAALAWVGVIVTNHAPAGADRSYSLDVVEEATTDAAVAAVAGASRAYPNPFAGSVDVRFAAPAAGPAAITVHDVRGRVVRRLGSGTRTGAGLDVRWDGLTDAGSPAPAGVYWVRVDGAAGSEARAVTRIR